MELFDEENAYTALAEQWEAAIQEGCTVIVSQASLKGNG